MSDKHQVCKHFLLAGVAILIVLCTSTAWAKCQEFPFGHNPQAQIEWYKKQGDPDCDRRIRTLEFLSAPTMPNLNKQPSRGKPPSESPPPSHKNTPSTPSDDFYIEENFDL